MTDQYLMDELHLLPILNYIEGDLVFLRAMVVYSMARSIEDRSYGPSHKLVKQAQ